ncbi:MAG: MFS transporter [Pyrinomonadaceae bacterium]|nr:MFS transporter [Pyrinomonadaceae bacterium]
MNRSPLLVIFITVFIDLVGFGIVMPVLPFYVEDPRFAASPVTLGWLFASYSIMQFIFSPILGRLSDKHGRRPVLLFSIIGTGIGFLIMGWATTLWMLFAGRILDGITGGNISTASAYIADVTTPENRAKGMGLIGAAFGLGFIFGPAIGGILSRWGVHVPFLFAAALAFLNAVLLYFTLPETVTPEHPARGVDRSFRALFAQLANARLAYVLAIYFLFIVAFSIMTTTFAFYTMFRFNYDAHQNGYLFAFIGVIAVIVQGGLIGRLAKRYGELPFVIAGAALFVAGLFALPFVGPTSGGLVALLGLLALFAGGNGMATPSLTSLASKSAGAAEQGTTLGLTQSAASLARIIGPLIGGFLIYSAAATAPPHVSDQTLRLTFWTAGALTFIALALTLHLAARSPKSKVQSPKSGISEDDTLPAGF